MKYCARCVMPETKPDLFFDKDGVCDACRSAELKNKVNWEERRLEFETLIEKYKNKDGSNYDCIIPVSGGKDSHYQTYICKIKYGLNPLLVSFEPTLPTELGKKNLKNLTETFGCDLIQFRKNPLVYKKMGRIAFERVGDHEWPNHLGIFTIPVKVAVNYQVPLIIWGENSQLEYGGPKAAAMKSVLNRRWLEEFGGLLGNRIEDMVGVDGLTKRELIPYFYPSQKQLLSAKIHGIFLGYYFKWDAKTQVEIMKKYGFSVKEDGPVEGTYTNYENLDDAIVHIHDYLKFVKYGFGRATDHACIDIRNGRLTRKDGAKLVQEYDGKLHQKQLRLFLEYYAMTRPEFFRIVDSFTNKALFETDKRGRLKRDKNGNLIRKFLP